MTSHDSASAAFPASGAGRPFNERLTPTAGWYVIAALAGASVGILFFPLFGPAVGIIAGLLSITIAVAGLVATSPVVQVAQGELRAGAAKIPVEYLSSPEPLTAQQTQLALGPELDARAYVCLRAWCRRAVRVDVTDERDPTPYWLISTRRPDELAHAIGAEQRATSLGPDEVV